MKAPEERVWQTRQAPEGHFGTEKRNSMLRSLANWIKKRQQIRRRWQQDARAMIGKHERRAYYEAQRLVARSRVQGDRSEFWHWAKVASEVARLSPIAEMDLNVVQAIADEEMRGHQRS